MFLSLTVLLVSLPDPMLDVGVTDGEVILVPLVEGGVPVLVGVVYPESPGCLEHIGCTHMRH